MPRAELDRWFIEERIDAQCQLLLVGAEQWIWASDVYPILRSVKQSAGLPSFDPFLEPQVTQREARYRRHTPPRQSQYWSRPAVLVWLYGGLLLSSLWVGSLVWHSFVPSHQIFQKVAGDAERQYGMAKRDGSAIDAYVAAGFTAAAYLQAEDEANYRKWKKIEATEAARAGISLP